MNATCVTDQLSCKFQSIPNIKLLNAYTIKYAPNMKVHNYFDYYTVIYCCEGEGFINADNIQFSVHRGDCFLFSSDSNSAIETVQHNHLKIVMISICDFLTDEECESIWKNGKTVLKLTLNGNAEIFEKMLNTLIKQSELCKSEADFILKSQAMDIISFLLRELHNTNMDYSESTGYSRQELIQEILDYIENNYSKSITLADIARHVYHSMYYVSHIFKEFIGTSPMQYAMNLKMKEGVRLLKDSQLPICEVAYALGYDDIHYFSYAFKRYASLPPRQFRKLHSKKAENDDAPNYLVV